MSPLSTLMDGEAMKDTHKRAAVCPYWPRVMMSQVHMYCRAGAGGALATRTGPGHNSDPQALKLSKRSQLLILGQAI